MQLDFDNYRTQTVNSYNNLVEELNKKKPDMFLVKETVKDLRKYIVFLTCLESEPENFKSLNIKVNSLK